MEIDGIIDEIQNHIDTIQEQQKKIIKSAYDECRKIRSSIYKSSEKVKEVTKKIIEETDPQLTEEGVQKITKKGKIYFRSLKAFNNLLHFIDNQFDAFEIPNPSEDLTYNSLNQFIRNVSKLMNDIQSERTTADQIMGLDFMLKKRSLYGPLNKISSDLNILRNLQKEGYRVIKTLEDLTHLEKDVEETLEKLVSVENLLQLLQNEYDSILKNLNDIESDHAQLLENPIVKESRQRSIRMTELEIKMGRHLNSFKKIFKKYAREVQRGSISSDFGIVNAALAYEENPVQRFLKEEDGNPEIIALIEELILVGSKDLNLKQNSINNLKHELNLIKKGNLDVQKAEWFELSKAKEEENLSSEFHSINKKLLECDKRLEEAKSELSSKEDEILLRKKEIDQLTESLIERRTRAKEITFEIVGTPTP